MIQWKKDNLPTRQEKEAAAKTAGMGTAAGNGDGPESCTERHGRNGGRSGVSHHHVGTGCLRYGRHR